jgi:hypothetical protein
MISLWHVKVRVVMHRWRVANTVKYAMVGLDALHRKYHSEA